MNWTNEQKEAIESKHANILVSAAAGSGKTAVLVERILSMIISEKISLDRLLVVTFTNAAASNMKEKIQKGIIQALALPNADIPFLREQLNKLSTANLSTIHGFCFNMLRRFFHIAEIDPNFKIMNGHDGDILLEEAIEEVMEHYFQNEDDHFIAFMDAYSDRRGDESIKNLVKSIYRDTLSYVNGVAWFKESIESLDQPLEELDNSQWAMILKQEAIELLGYCKEVIEKAISICPQEFPYYEAISQDLEDINHLYIGLSQGIDEFLNRLRNLDHMKLKPIKKEHKIEFGEALGEEIKAYRESYKDSVVKANKAFPFSDTKVLGIEMRQTYPVMKALSNLLEAVHHKYQEAKGMKKSLDFSDAEHMAMKILEFDEVREYYKKRFQFIFIDEYQDTNGVQEGLINHLSKGDNLFMVGDIKQSIYRFRQADPTIFIEKYENYGQGDNKNKLILLNKNFRSRKEILEFINNLFGILMRKGTAEIDYDNRARLISGTHFPADDGAVEIDIIESKPDEGIEIDIKEMKAAQLEAKHVANRIETLIGQTTYDPAEANRKQISYSDMVVLVRSSARWGSIFEEVFNEKGIPFYSEANNNYFESTEIEVTVNLLKLLDNKRQDIPLLSVMRSQIGKFSIDDMVKIRLQSRNTSFFNALCSYKENKNDHLAFKINQFISRLNGWKEQSKNSRISDLLWDILMKTDYFYFAGMLPNGLIRQGNLRLLIERASQYEQNGNTSIVDFIQYLERVKSRGGGDFSTAKILGENDNVVRMMTIHKSKGLEFPIVFCCGLGRTFNLSDLNDPIITNKICRVAPTYVNIEKRTRKMTLPQYAAKIQIKKENIAEEMRILYVAFTRAIDRLILVGTIPKYENWVEKCRQSIIGEFAIKGKRSYLDWIGIVLNQNSHNQYAINRITLSDLYEDTSRAKKNHQNLIHNLMNLPVDEAMQKEFQRKYNWRYEYKTENNLPGKLSVTDIQNMSVDKVESIRFKTPSLKDIPTYMGKEVGFSAAEIGTIHHAVLQLMPLRDEMTLQLIKDAIGKMVDKKLLTEEEAKVVDASKILGFYLSGIGRRMISAEYIKREQPFIIKKSASQILSNSKSDQAGDVLIQGIIDCFFVEGEEIILVDYKTDSISNRVDWLASHYKKQIEIYKEALETLTGKPVKESYLYLISHGQSIKML